MRRRIFISLSLGAGLILSACGFTPMHSTSPGGVQLADLYVDMKKGANVVDNQAGFFVTQRLRDRIGAGSETAPYRLQITPRYRRRRFGLTDADIASRYDITVTAKWSLFDTKSGKRISGGNASSTSTFGASDGPYGVITADNVGVEQAAKETADKLVLQLARALSDQNK